MTYQVNRETYATAPYFLWQKPRPEPSTITRVMRDFYRWELAQFEDNRTLGGAFRRTARQTRKMVAVLSWSGVKSALAGSPVDSARPPHAVSRWSRSACSWLGLLPANLDATALFRPGDCSAVSDSRCNVCGTCSFWRGRHSDMGAAAVRIDRGRQLRHVRACASGLSSRILRSNQPGRAEIWIVSAIRRTNLIASPGTIWSLFAISRLMECIMTSIMSGCTTRPTSMPRKLSGPAIWASGQNQELLDYFKDRRVWRLNGDDSQPELQVLRVEVARGLTIRFSEAGLDTLPHAAVPVPVTSTKDQTNSAFVPAELVRRARRRGCTPTRF